MKFKLLAFFCLFSINQTLFSTEERNPYPFFRIASKKMDIVLENLNVSICLIKTEDVFDYTLATKETCGSIKENVWNSIQKILKEKPKKKEFIFQFFDKNETRMKAQFSSEKANYELISMIYYKQEKVFYLELFDSEKNYYFFQANPKMIRFKVKI